MRHIMLLTFLLLAGCAAPPAQTTTVTQTATITQTITMESERDATTTPMPDPERAYANNLADLTIRYMDASQPYREDGVDAWKERDYPYAVWTADRTLNETKSFNATLSSLAPAPTNATNHLRLLTDAFVQAQLILYGDLKACAQAHIDGTDGGPACWIPAGWDGDAKSRISEDVKASRRATLDLQSELARWQ